MRRTHVPDQTNVKGVPKTWEDEADVVVVGYGGGGAVTAIAAADAGSRVLILEKSAAHRHVNNTNVSGGLFVSPNDPAKAFQYIKACIGDTVDDTMCHTWAEATSQNVAYLQELAKSVGEPSDVVRIHGAEFPDLPGAEGIDAYRLASGSGAKLFEILEKCVQARKKIRVDYSTPGKKLIQGEGGEILGVVAERDGKPINIRARRATILSTGGFEYNEQMKLNAFYGNPRYFYGPDCNTGDGLLMAMGAGAQLWHMNWSSQHWGFKYKDFPLGFNVDFPKTKPNYIIVDQYGKRFFNENYNGHSSYAYFILFDPLIGSYPRLPGYLVFDETLRTMGKPLSSGQSNGGVISGKTAEYGYDWSTDQSTEIARGWIMKANTIAELADAIRARQSPNQFVDYTSKIKMDPATFASTIATYNGYVKNGKDLDFGRPAHSLAALETPPFYATEVWPVGPNTQGGPKFDPKGRVFDVFGKPIPRLYKAGELGSIYGERYPSGGGNIAEILAFGRIAGQNAAKERP